MTRNQICSAIAGVLGVLAVFRSLLSVALLIVAITFALGTLFGLRSGRLDRMSLGISVVSAALFFGFFFVPVWYQVFTATTPEDHLRLSEAYRFRGQIFGNDSEVLHHLTIAADGGNIVAAKRLGEAYMFGHYRVTTNLKQARRWLTVASSAGSPSATHLLKELQADP